MKYFKVHAWISESDYELVRLEAEAIDNVPFGLGVLARLHKGASSRSCGARSMARYGFRRSRNTPAARASGSCGRCGEWVTIEYSGLQEVLRRYLVELPQPAVATAAISSGSEDRASVHTAGLKTRRYFFW